MLLSLWRIVNRIVLFSVVVVLSVNALAWAVINSPPVQRAAVDWLNKELLAVSGIQISFESISLGLFTSSVSINGLEIRSSSAKLDDPFGKVAEFKIGVDALGSWLERKLVLRKASVFGLDLELGYDANGNLIFPVELPSSPVPEKAGDVAASIASARKFLPPVIEIESSRIVLGKEDSNNYQYIAVRRVVFGNVLRDNVTIPMRLQVEIDPSLLRFPALEADLKVEDLVVTLGVKNDLFLTIEELKAASSVGALKLNGTVQVPIIEKALSYNGNLELDARFADALSLLGLSAKGAVRLAGKLSAPLQGVVPDFQGSVSWQDASVQGMDLYSGGGDVELKKSIASFKKAKIVTAKKGELQLSGQLELFGEYAFRSQVQLENMVFLELMQGLGVKTDAVDFKFRSDALTVNGKVSGNAPSPFALEIVGELETRDLVVPSLHDAMRSPLPNCAVKLRLKTTVKELNLKDTQASCRNERLDSIIVTKGTVNYSNGEVAFAIDAKDFDFSPVAYFSKSTVKGIGDFSGAVVANATTPVRFYANTKIRNVLLYEIPFDTLDGFIQVDEKGVSAKDVKGVFGDSNVFLSELFVGFDQETTSIFEGLYRGDFTELQKRLSSYLPLDFPAIEGATQSTRVSLRGPLLQPRRWRLNADIAVTDLGILGQKARSAVLNIDCELGICIDSRLELKGITSPSPGKVRQREGEILAEFERLPFDLSSAVRGKILISGVPVHRNFGDRFPASAVLDARVEVSGIVSNWEGALQASLDEVKLGDRELGSATISGFTSLGSEISIVAQTRNQQITATARLPHNLEGPGSLFLRTRNFDLSVLMSESTIAKYNFFSRVDGEVLFTGPAPLTPLTQLASTGSVAGVAAGTHKQNWISYWVAQGRLTSAEIQAKQLTLRLKEAQDFKIANGALEFNDLNLHSLYGSVKIGAKYLFESKKLTGEVRSKIDLALARDLVTRLSDSKGVLTTNLSFAGEGGDLKLRGLVKVQEGLIAVRDYPPPFSNIEADVSFEESRMEIRTLRASKGTGTVDMAGSVDWSLWLDDASRGINLALQVTLNDALFGVPSPYVDSFETVVDGALQIKGSDRPYLISGDIRLKKAATYRDKSCQEMLAEEAKAVSDNLKLGTLPFARLNVSVVSEQGILLQTGCIKTRLSANVKLVGTTQEPLLQGVVDTDNGVVSFIKSNFIIQKIELNFDNTVRLDPRLDIQLISRIEGYSVYVNVDGTLSKRRTNLWVDPPSTPEGVTLTRTDIFRMLSTGQPPNKSGTQSQALFAQVAGYVYGATALDDSLTQAAQRLTGGFIESVRLQPVIENGQTRWKARVSRSIGDRLSLGLDIEQGQQVNNQSLNGTVLLNDNVNLLGGFDRKAEESQQYYEFSGGLRFQFGTAR